MRRYETLFIVDPELTNDGLKEVAEKLTNIILSDKGHVIKYDEWGKRKLAYPVKKHDYGYYILLDYCGPSDIVNELERNMRIDERVLKYITVKLSDAFTQEELDKLKEKAGPKIEPAAESASVSEKESSYEAESTE